MKKTKSMAVLLAIITAFSFIVGGLVSCSKPLKISDEEALMVLKDLVPKSYDINVIFFGEGLPAVDEAYKEEHSETAYFKVRDDAPYSSINDIKAAAEKVYSKRYLDGIYGGAFTGVATESSDGMVDASVSPRYKEIGGKLMVDVSVAPKQIRGRLEVISAEVTKKTPGYVIVSMTYSENGKQSVADAYLTLENDVWLLDGPTY